MLVSRILLELDAQLERLQTARDTIASLIAAPPLAPTRPSRKRSLASAKQLPLDAKPAETIAVEAVAVKAPAAPVVPAVPAKRRGRPKGSVNRYPAARRTRAAQPAEPTALARVVATGPVFVPAAELERRRAQTLVMAAPKPVEAPAPEGTLDALIREVAERQTATAA